METVSIDLSAGEAYSFASVLQRNDLTASWYRVRIKAVGNSALASLYTSQWMARAVMGKDMGSGSGASTTPILGDDAAMFRAAAKGIIDGRPLAPNEPELPPWLSTLYDANLRVCRTISRDGFIEPPRAWMPDFDPFTKIDPARFNNPAAPQGAVVAAAVVGVAAAVAFAVAWWARGKEEARVGMQTTTVRQQAAVAAATRVALAYVAQGKDPPPEFLAAINDLGHGEGARAWAVPLAIALPITVGVGVGVWAAVR